VIVITGWMCMQVAAVRCGFLVGEIVMVGAMCMVHMCAVQTCVAPGFIDVKMQTADVCGQQTEN
jgi:N-acyl-D-aspartate/D-glutamate deacylase